MGKKGKERTVSVVTVVTVVSYLDPPDDLDTAHFDRLPRYVFPQQHGDLSSCHCLHMDHVTGVSDPLKRAPGSTYMPLCN